MLSVGRHAKVTVYGRGRGGEGSALQSRSKESQRKAVLPERWGYDCQENNLKVSVAGHMGEENGLI